MKPMHFLSLFFLFNGFIACQQQDVTDPAPAPETQAPAPIDTAGFAITADTLYDGLKNPWGMAWLSDGRLLVTEREGGILIFKNDKFTGEKLEGVPEVWARGQGGLMDIKLHPDYKKNGWIYITYSKPEAGGAATAVMRFKVLGNRMVSKEEIFVAKPFIEADFHFGSRVVFDNENHLFVSVGERGTQPKVQELTNDLGKIHRLTDDGHVPAGNPFAGKGNESIWTYGHRNPQGMVYDPTNNRIWEIEHGPKGGDELNLIEPGKNYGWPKTSYGINYDGTVLTPYQEMDGITNPVRYWVPSIAPCGALFVTSDRYPGWKGNILVCALSFRHIARVQLSGTKYIGEEKLLQDVGRFRFAAESPDGYIYAISEGPGLLLKLMPNK